ncbi:hypothetical protein Y032_0150g2738 [Ancylostoma ceylanicum]|uniref:Uncharacterized protein n=1 Tax=Ancylostoma ceylanicum TaxID=53326 RepID=A0A016T148_9BILA|nr:hypothetical protein Y032_0150g2738 [Ancylostoma ceylanicum]
MESDEMRPEQLPSLYGEIQNNALDKVVRPPPKKAEKKLDKHDYGAVPSDNSVTGDPYMANDKKDLAELQGTMEDESEKVVQETQRSSPRKEDVLSAYVEKQTVPLNQLEQQPLQPIIKFK